MTSSNVKNIAVSIVSHGQGKLVEKLLSELSHCNGIAEIIITLNIPESKINYPTELIDNLKIFNNPIPLGFAANHNKAFFKTNQPYFLVLNPDIEFNGSDPFPTLISIFKLQKCALIVPKIINQLGEDEDSIRHFPTPFGLLMKCLRMDNGSYKNIGTEPKEVDWAAGMFMLFCSEAFQNVGGFDENYFLYYEDVDICARLWRAGLRVLACPSEKVVHDARRESRKNLRYFMWHFSSLIRFMFKHLGRSPRDV